MVTRYVISKMEKIMKKWADKIFVWRKNNLTIFRRVKIHFAIIFIIIIRDTISVSFHYVSILRKSLINIFALSPGELSGRIPPRWGWPASHHRRWSFPAAPTAIAIDVWPIVPRPPRPPHSSVSVLQLKVRLIKNLTLFCSRLPSKKYSEKFRFGEPIRCFKQRTNIYVLSRSKFFFFLWIN